MAIDPTRPVNGVPVDANFLRGQFIDLDGRVANAHQRIDAIPAGPPGRDGSDGSPGANGIDGRGFNLTGEWDGMATYNRLDLVTSSGMIFLCNTDGTSGATPGMDSRWTQVTINVPAFPHNGDAQINGNVINDGTNFVHGDVALYDNDPNGSGENSVRIGKDTAGGVPVPSIALRMSGANLFSLKFDLGGFGDGIGNATIQDGAIYRVDLMSGTLKPWNVTVQTINYTDSNGNPASMQVIVPPP